MLRVTLLEDFGKRVRMAFGYETAIPMHFGAISDPALMVDFRGPREPLPAKQTVYYLDWANEDERSTLIPPEAVLHYFGNMNAASGDDVRVRNLQVPEFNQERNRVAAVWGDYLYSDAHGPYVTIRIKEPDIPKVRIVPVNANGVSLPGAWEYEPHAFFRFAEILDPNAAAELAALRARKPTVAPLPQQALDISNLSPEQLEALILQIDRFTAIRNTNTAREAHREKMKAGNA